MNYITFFHLVHIVCKILVFVSTCQTKMKCARNTSPYSMPFPSQVYIFHFLHFLLFEPGIVLFSISTSPWFSGCAVEIPEFSVAEEHKPLKYMFLT